MQLFVPYFGVVESVPCYESQHCDEQQFQTVSCVHYTIFSVVKLDLFIRALLLDRILALEKTTRTPRIHLVIIITYFQKKGNDFQTFPTINLILYHLLLSKKDN